MSSVLSSSVFRMLVLLVHDGMQSHKILLEIKDAFFDIFLHLG